MSPIKIKPLTQFNLNEFQQVAPGYTSTEKYTVRKTETDGQTTITLTLEPFPTPYVKQWEHDEEILDLYASTLAEGLSLGCYDGEKLVGVAIAEKRSWSRTLWIWEFEIMPGYQRQGLGSRMMDALAEIARRADCRIMVAEAQNTNVPGIRFYRKNGFEIGGVDLSYYTNTDMSDFEVAVFMKRPLQP